MINLIPPDGRERIVTEYWVRVLTVWLWLLALVATVVAVLLLPAYVLVSSQADTFEETAALASEQNSNKLASSQALVNASAKARLILAQEAQPKILSPILHLDSVTPKGIELTSYNLVRTASGFGAFAVSGTALSRSSLAAFREALLSDPLITKVDLPISNFAQERDIDFSLSVTLASSSTAI